MEWTTVAALALFALACLLALYRSRADDWAIDRRLGAGLFLVGVAIGLFLDDLLAGDSPLLPWVEPIGAAVILAGLCLPWIWDSA